MIKPYTRINTLTQTVGELKIVEALHPYGYYRNEASKMLIKLAMQAQLEAYQEQWLTNFVDEYEIEQEQQDKFDAENAERDAYELYANNIAEFHDYHCKLEDGEIPTHMSFRSYLASIYTNFEIKDSSPNNQITYQELVQSEATKNRINRLFAQNPKFKNLGIEIEMV